MVLGQHTWLDDKVIDHAQALLKAQHANIGGLHATTSLALLSTVPTLREVRIPPWSTTISHADSPVCLFSGWGSNTIPQYCEEPHSQGSPRH
ncbi:hypothetical protein SKAU_G00094810 [Synaphobranchus kaupii]|uniref:Uncharacterized protein n=1 Tax=Synaphobranchus kaupii TaxID=118154 RepID=A0A9Q1J6V3_SYNKA|nr:hypothetical protein SKAU_G00094810 [Synaphobranchus kaupii]